MKCCSGLRIRLPLLLFFLAASVPGYADEKAAIEQFHSQLLLMMALPTQHEREEHIRPSIDQLFDVERIARVSLGRSWRALEADSQQAFVALLREHVVATYAARFSENRGQTFSIEGFKQVRKGVVVQSSISPVDGDAVKLDYFFRDGKVFNIAADGVSDLSLRRADYNSVLKSSGFAALAGHVKRQLQELRELRDESASKPSTES